MAVYLTGRCAKCGYEVNWTLFRGYGSIRAIDKIPPGRKLDALAAEKVFGWRNVHQHEGTLVSRIEPDTGD
jgi:hypothetical protein